MRLTHDCAANIKQTTDRGEKTRIVEKNMHRRRQEMARAREGGQELGVQEDARFSPAFVYYGL